MMPPDRRFRIPVIESLPAASSERQGQVWRVRGTPDAVWFCGKNSGGTYTWIDLSESGSDRPEVLLSDYSPDPSGVTSSKTAILNALAEIETRWSGRGGTLLVEPGRYYVPGGIAEEIPGLRVISTGNRKLGPGEVEDIGAVFFNDTAGAWTWEHGDPAATENEYSGAAFENLVFSGDPDVDTAGGLLRHTNNDRVVNCAAFRHRTGTGFKSEPPTGVGGGTTGDASWSYFESNYSVDCLYGLDMGGDTPGGSGGGQTVACVTLKTGNPNSNVAQHTGWGFRFSSTNHTVIGGKAEQEGIGALVNASTGVVVSGMRAEACDIGFDLDRAAGTPFASGIQLLGILPSNSLTTNVRIGAEQWNDIVIGNLNDSWVDNGRGTYIRDAGRAEMVNAPGYDDVYRTLVNADGSTLLTESMTEGVNVSLPDAGFGSGMFYHLANHTNVFFRVTNGTLHIIEARGNGQIGFFGATPVSRPTVTGSTADEKADSVIAALATLGLATDSTT